jgi:trehalose 6-phosphate synthase
VSGYERVVVANRLPVSGAPGPDGDWVWHRSPGGLVSALDPVLDSASTVWVGWSGVPSDALDPSQPSGLDAPGLGPCDLHEVPLSAADVEAFYEGFSNSTLWPLYHDAIATPVYHRHQWTPYVEVNQRFAREVAGLAAEGATVWVHDYQLQLLPQMLRERRPDLRIGFFLHIPFPPAELFLQLPWRTEVILGLLGADVVGFQTPGGAANFRSLVARLLGSEPSDGQVPAPNGRTVQVGSYPISIDSGAHDRRARLEQTEKAAAELRAQLGNPRHLLLGVDRLDYTKGIDVRIKAFTELLADGSLDPHDCVFVQVATPSRENVEDYQRLRDEIELMLGRALADHGTISARPIHYLYQPLEREELSAFYRAADVMLVTPYRDGMNLVAKEYVASRVDDDGALVLSEFAGAAVELCDAFLVNPYDADQVKAVILEAVHAGTGDLARRMRAMRDQVMRHDVSAWASAFLADLERA